MLTTLDRGGLVTQWVEKHLRSALGLPTAARYTFSLLAVASALLLKLWLGASFPPFITFFLAVPIVAFTCGLLPGLLAAVLSALLAWWFFLSAGDFAVPPAQEAGLLLTFLVVASVQILSFHWLRSALARLEFARSQYARVIDLIQEAVWIHLDGKLVYVNRHALEMLGANSPAELIGREVTSLFAPEEQQRAAARIETIVRERQPALRGEFRLRRLDGSAIIVAGQAAPFEQDGRMYIVGSLLDITAQREAEAQLRQAQKMDAIGQLTGGIAHDFNNLLTVIVGNLETATDDRDSPVHVRHAAQSALGAAERGAELVRRLLAVARRQVLEPKPIDLGEVIESEVPLLSRVLGTNVEIETAVGDELWQALADRGQVENAILNLAINARDAMPSGGKLTIQTANAHLDEEYAARNAGVPAGDYVMLAVTDTGSGMPPEVLNRAVEPFFTTKDRSGGTGLGLAMIYGFMKQSGGHMKIYSEVGHGTVVRLYLPRVDPPSSSGMSSARDMRLPAGAETILVVEDDNEVRSLVVTQLSNLGYRVVEASDGPSAEMILRSGTPVDLVFTDIVMPGGMSGRDVAERARALKPGVKILYTSGFTEDAVVHQGRLDGGEQLLSKPYRRADLARAVRKVLDTDGSR